MAVVLTADRYIVICRSLHATQYSTMPRLRRAVIVLWVLAVVYSLPVFFEIEVVEVEMDHVSPSDSLALNGSDVVSDNLTMADTFLNLTQNSTPLESGHVLILQWSAMSRNQVYQVVYRACLDFVVRFLLPLAALVFFNKSLLHALRQSDQLRRHRATDSAMGRNTRGCWWSSSSYSLSVSCQTWPCVSPTCCWSTPASHSACYAITVNNLMLVVNSSVNVVIYCFMGCQFRSILLRMIGCGSEHENAGRNLEVDPGRPMVHLHHIPHPAEQPQLGRESPTSHQSTSNNAVCQVDVVVDVHEMTFEVELDTRGVGRTSTPRGDSVDISQDVQALVFCRNDG